MSHLSVDAQFDLKFKNFYSIFFLFFLFFFMMQHFFFIFMAEIFQQLQKLPQVYVKFHRPFFFF